MFRFLMASMVTVSSLASVSTLDAGTVTTGTLAREMVDMHRLTRTAAPFYHTVQYASYDHRSTLPGGPGWFDNSDGFGNEPVPNFEAVLEEPGDDGVGTYLVCDIQGPGAMVRTWTAAITGTFRIFLDGADEPIYEGKAQDFLVQPYRSFAAEVGFDNELLGQTFYQRNAAYCPIPFAKGCRIEYVGKVKEIHFYQIQFRVYQDAADVKTFTAGDLKTYADDIKRTARILGSPEQEWPYRENAEEVAYNLPLMPNSLLEPDPIPIKGGKAVERLAVRVTAKDMDKALKQTIMHIACDEYPWGQVQSPIGDFFGAAPGINPYESAPFTVRPDGVMICRYVMPFEKSLQVKLENKGDQEVKVELTLALVDHEWDPESSMHFRARWRADHDLLASNRHIQDIPYLMAKGSGRFVGAACYLLNANNIPSSGGNWWGEGDEKIFVDDDRFPSTFGTGSEDYYNYAWSSHDIFLHPYCGQPVNDGPANRGFVTNYRYHVVDDLPFADFFAFYMELYHHTPTDDFSYARIAYHYGRPGLIDDHLPITGEDVRHLELPPNWQPESREAAYNSEFFQAEESMVDGENTSILEDPMWSGGKLLVWSPKKKGEQLKFNFSLPMKGRWITMPVFRRDGSGGKVGILLNGKAVGFGGEENVTETFVPHRTLSRESRGPKIAMDEGEHSLTLIYKGPPEGKDKAEVGIDFLWLQRP